MLIPGIVFYLIFVYWPYFELRQSMWNWGVLGPKEFIGFSNFAKLLVDNDFWTAFFNTLIMSGIRIILEISAAIILALLLNEVRIKLFKRGVQTILYLPHFLSWVVTSSIFLLMLSPTNGFINGIIEAFGCKSVYFITELAWWRPIYFFIRLWHDSVWATIIFLATLAGIDPELYEAACIDGAGHWKRTLHITLPHLYTTIIIVLMINLSRIFRLFEPVFVLQNPLVYEVSDVIQTYVYRKGFLGGNYDYGIAVGIFNSLISLVLVLVVNALVKKVRKEGIF